MLRRLQRQEEDILKALENLETEKTRLEAELTRPEVYANGEKAKTVKQRLDLVAGMIETKNAEWEEKAAELEEAKAPL
jgi:ATP-binding cassette subfamily F protein 3